MSDVSIKETIAAIHAAPHKGVIEFAGAGSQALAWLHGEAGSSRTVLEAGDRYAATSLSELVGFTPDQFTSPQVAQLMAGCAFRRARALTKEGPVFGLGCTATIATDRSKRGEHRAHVALRDAREMTTYSLTLSKGARTRAQEEDVVSRLIVRALSRACGVTTGVELPLRNQETIVARRNQEGLLAWLLSQDVACIACDAEGVLSAHPRQPGIALLSGSFNPLHEGHKRLAQVAAERLGKVVCFELSLINAEKAPLTAEQAQRRVAQFRGVGTVLLTKAPLFGQKAKLFPHSVFVVGADTAARLVQPRFYQDSLDKMNKTLSDIHKAGCRFLVAGRIEGRRFVTLEDLAIPPAHRCLFEGIPEDAFRSDLSSTALRGASCDTADGFKASGL